MAGEINKEVVLCSGLQFQSPYNSGFCEDFQFI